MPWRYRQSTGELFWPDGELLTVGYAGHDDGDGIPEPGEGKNDPSKQGVRNTGPLPRGRYSIGPPEPGHGGYALRLTPMPGTDTLGRGGFLIHGDSVRNPGSASLGCIIVSRWARMQVWTHPDHELEVVE